MTIGSSEGLHAGPVQVRVPASSANLGPGFDSLGLALGLYDDIEAQVVDGPLRIEVSGEGAGQLPLDERHLVRRAVVATFDEMGLSVPAVRLSCRNVVPHARGLGSSSAAIVGGIVAARALVVDGRERLDDDAALSLATRIEGHPDNVAPALLGGLTVAVTDDRGHVSVARLVPDPAVAAVVLIPATGVATEVARGLLPAEVPHADAAANAGRTALLVAALTGQPGLLLEATVDRLHQQYRRPAMPETLALVDSLRAEGVPAVVSGAGPTVLALVGAAEVASVAAHAPGGWAVHTPAVGVPGASATVLD